MFRRALWIGPSLLAWGACAPEEPGEPLVLADTRYDAHPEAPAILRDVALVDDDAAFTQPFVPGMRTTADGRVGIRVQGGPPGPQWLMDNLSFYLFAPEKLTEPVMAGPPGAEILATTEPFLVEYPPALEPGITRTGHHAICDPSEARLARGEQPNPYLCGPDGRHDCYDLTIVSSTTPTLGTTLWGMDVTVEVSDPKTPAARIVEVRAEAPVQGMTIPLTTEWMEPAITLDGRLLTGRVGHAPRTWVHPDTGESFTRHYDLMYSVMPEGAEPCDVTAWTSLNPMSHAPYDPHMVGRYGLAAFPFRDTEGNPIPDGEDLGGTYPWVDREGANVFMTGVHGTIAEQSHERFPRRCVVAGCDDMPENVDWDRGFMVGGLWTHGKFVHLDGLINNQDWAVGVSPASHYLVDLYQDASGEAVEVRFGSGRFIDELRRAGGPYPPGYTHNANILDSLQQLGNHQPNLVPITPRDVVWIMGTGVATDEIVFDDLMDPHALIVANMQASITQHVMPNGHFSAIPIHHNGQVRDYSNIIPLARSTPLDPDADADIHLQNASTSLRWQVPAYGHIDAGTARIEPVALGGIQGRGLWLSGDAAVRWDLPTQEGNLLGRDKYLGLFVDGRTPDGEARSLLTFPDGTAVVLRGRSAVQYVADDRVVHEVALPPTDGWLHLGWRVLRGHRELILHVNGQPVDRYEPEEPMATLEGGALVMGRAAGEWTGFRGWVDELVVLAHDVDPETACNHARGTLVELVDAPALADRAAWSPDWAHAEIAERAGISPEARVVCHADYTHDYAAHLANLPEGTRSLRQRLHFPEGPLLADQHRPDSTDNAFCTSCHTAEGQGGLSLQALAPNPGLAAQDDRRRFPSQPPMRVWGNIPAGWIAPGPGPGGPSEAMQAPPEGLPVDAWLLPSSGAERQAGWSWAVGRH